MDNNEAGDQYLREGRKKDETIPSHKSSSVDDDEEEEEEEETNVLKLQYAYSHSRKWINDRTRKM